MRTRPHSRSVSRCASRSTTALLQSLESRTLLSGVTVIAHGYEPDGSTPGWISSMGNAILTRAGGGSMYSLKIKSQFLGDAKVDSFTKLSGPDSSAPSNTTGETVLLVDWSDASSVVFPFYPANEIASLVIPYLTQAQSSKGISAPLAQGSIQLIGHSRGASVVSEIARQLGSSGIWVDQLTTLDPVPVGEDPDISVRANTLFADNYYETNSVTPGKAITNAYNVGPLNLGSAYSLVDGGQHNDVFLFYYGTIDTSANANNGDHSVPASWYPNNNVNRNTTGFYYSRIGGGTKPNSGVSAQFGGSAGRAAITRSGTQWGNIATVSTATTSLTAGQSFQASFRYQSADGSSTIAWYLDPDKNPYNGNEVLVKDPALYASTGDGVASQNATVTASASAGNYYVFGKIRKGTNERVAYTKNTLQVKASTPPTGTVDQITSSVVSGWVIDLDTPTTAIQFRIDVDNNPYLTATTTINRPDVNALYNTSGDHGFSANLVGLAGGAHTISVYALDSANGNATLISSGNIISPYPAIGSVDGANANTIFGWSLDQDTPSQSNYVRIAIDGVDVATFITDINRPDVNAAFSTTGNHGFEYTLPTLAGGPHTISVYGLDSVDYSPSLIASANIVTPYAPIGIVDSVTAASLSGWTFDPDSPSTSIQVRVDIDGVTYSTFATNTERPDVNSFFNITGTHGFAIDLPALSVGLHRIDIYALDSTTSAPTLLSSTNLNTNRPPQGWVDGISIGSISGWAWDQDTPSSTVRVRIHIDSLPPIYVNANVSRPDVDAYTGGPHAFQFALPQLTAGTHSVSVYALDTTSDAPTLLATQSVFVAASDIPTGYIDVANTTTVSGWAYDPSTSDPINIRIDIDGVPGTPFLTDLLRADVNAAFSLTANHGFSYTLPSLSPGAHTLDIYALDNPSATPVLLNRVVVGPTSLQGSVDFLSATLATGWAFNAGLDAAPAKVRIDIDDFLGTASLAANNRADLIPLFGSPDHGFSIALPTLTSGTHRVRIYILDDYQPAQLLLDYTIPFA